MKKFAPFLKTLVIALGTVFVFREASAQTLAFLSLLTLWLAVLPGTLVVALVLKKPLQKLETWILGAAIGINFLPVFDTIGTFFSSDAGLIWNVVVIGVSLINLASLGATLRKKELSEDSIRVPIFPLLVVLLTFISTFLFHRFFRDSAHGVYSFNVYFGGDMGCLGSDVLCLETHTSLSDWQFGGLPVSYHDFTYRLLAGMHRISGGNIYDALWYFQSPFALLLLLSLLWLVVKKLTKESVMAWVAVALFFLGRGTYLTFIFDSPSMQLGLVECFAALYFIVDAAKESNLELQRGAGILYAVLIAFFAAWKLTLVMVLLPAIFFVALIRGVREKKWGLMLLTSAGTVISGLFFLHIYAHSGSYAGQDILGRPLVPMANFVNRLLGTSLRPVMPFAELSLSGTLALLALLPIYAMTLVLLSGRFLVTLFLFPGKEFARYRVPYLVPFFVVLLFLGSLFEVFISPQHYFISDPYQPFFAHIISLVAFAIVVGHFWIERKNGVFRRVSKLTLLIVLVAIAFELTRGFRAYEAWYNDKNDTVSIALLNDLDSASTRLPPNALVATRRFNVRANFTADPLKQSRLDSADWNFEFYAVSLHRPVVLEGPLDGFYGGCASPPEDSSILATPEPSLSRDLWRRSALLDTIYDSHSDSAALAAIHSLGATHLLIDKTIDQRIASGIASRFDTVFAGKAALVLRVR